MLTVDYFEGFNLNFDISRTEAKSIMPTSQFSPFKLKLLEDDFETGARRYYVSWYIAKITADISGTPTRIGRADIFTYAWDPKGEPSLVFLGVILEIPKEFQSIPGAVEAYKEIAESFSVDSRTGQVAYPHYYTETFEVSPAEVKIAVGNEIFRVATDTCDASQEPAAFSRNFLLANSQVYRTPIDKNVNYFNKDFISAEVKLSEQDCLSVENADSISGINPAGAELVSAHLYGSPVQPIRWHYEDVTSSAGTPFLTLEEKQERAAFKWNTFGTIWSERAADISNGDAETLVSIKTTNMLYLNWEMSQDGAQKFSEDFNLAKLGYSLAPIKVLAGDDERYLLTLNAYNVEFVGFPEELSKAVRFEFSAYVTSMKDPQPRFFLFEALSSLDTIDPTNGPVPASDVFFSVEGNDVSLGDSNWQFGGTLDTGDGHETMKDWIVATDIVYWGNGVADKVFYDSRMAAQPCFLVQDGSLSGAMKWMQYLVDPNPAQVAYFLEGIEFVIQPWFNLKDESLSLTNQERDSLQQLKASTYSGLATLTSALVRSGELEPLVDVVVYGEYPATPRVVLNFEIRAEHKKEFQGLIGLPDEYKLSKMRMTGDAPQKYMLTFSIFEETLLYKSEPFYKAVWAVYIEEANGGSGDKYLHEFHVETSSLNLDVEQILKPPAETFNVNSTDGTLNVQLLGQDVQVSLSVPLVSLTGDRHKQVVSDEWVFAHDRVFWHKGVFDKLFYNGYLWNALVILVQDSDGEIQITQSTPWSRLVTNTPFQTLFFDQDVKFVTNPWKNIEEL